MSDCIRCNCAILAPIRASAPSQSTECGRPSLSLAFDHGRIVQEALVRLRNKASYSSLPALLLPTSFTMPQLQRVYECALGMDLNTGAFRRKVEDLGLIEPVDEQRPAPGAGRPAQVYRLASQTLQDLGRVVMTPDRRRGGLSP